MSTAAAQPAAPRFSLANPAPADHYCKWCGYRGGNHSKPAGTPLVGTHCRECYRVATE